MKPKTKNRDPLAHLGTEGIFRSADLEAVGLHRSQLPRLIEQGEVERLGRGLYRRTSEEISQHITVAAVCRRVPQAIVCLLTALRIHEIGTQSPWEVWIGLDRKARKPRFQDLAVRIVRFSGSSLDEGVEEMRIQGVRVKITSPARTVVDCFRYRNKIGLDVALEALRETVQGRKATPAEIVRTAEALRARTVILPYVESLVA